MNFLSDTYGGRRILLADIFPSTLVSLLCFMATSNNMLVTGPFFQGLGVSVGPVIARSVIDETFDKTYAISGIMSLIPTAIPIIGS